MVNATDVTPSGPVPVRLADAVALATVGFRALSMRPASIGRVKYALRGVDLGEVRAAIAGAEASGEPIRPALDAMIDDPSLG